jgi:prophage regulatory protein
MQTNVILPETGYIRQAQLVGNKGKGIAGVIPFSPATLWRKVGTGEFPAPVKLSAGVTAWKVEDVRDWISKH